MIFFQEIIKKSNAYIWYTGFIVSLVLLSFVIYQIDFSQIELILDSISWPFFLLATCILLSEGLFTALRFKLFTPGNQSIKSCLEVTAWFIISLIILPARLGEIAVILLLKEKLGQSTGSSIMNVLTQRFIDILFLCTMLIIFLLLIQNYDEVLFLYVSIFLFMTILALSLYKLDNLLSIIARLLFFKKIRPKNKILRTLLRMSLQARIWHKFHITKEIYLKVILVSIFKWMSNIGGLTLLFYSINIPLNEVQLLLSSTAYNFLSIIPLQTIGGFGISEAGLTGIFSFFGLSISLAASVSILIRLVLISTPFIFFFIFHTYFLFINDEKSS